jgi:hypothetical protein
MDPLKRLFTHLGHTRRVIRHRAESKSQAQHAKVVKRTQRELAQLERAITDTKTVYGVKGKGYSC